MAHGNSQTKYNHLEKQVNLSAKSAKGREWLKKGLEAKLQSQMTRVKYGIGESNKDLENVNDTTTRQAGCLFKFNFQQTTQTWVATNQPTPPRSNRITEHLPNVTSHISNNRHRT